MFFFMRNTRYKAYFYKDAMICQQYLGNGIYHCHNRMRIFLYRVSHHDVGGTFHPWPSCSWACERGVWYGIEEQVDDIRRICRHSIRSGNAMRPALLFHTSSGVEPCLCHWLCLYDDSAGTYMTNIPLFAVFQPISIRIVEIGCGSRDRYFGPLVANQWYLSP